MHISENNLEVVLPGYGFGLSFRRLWEHFEHSQINPFKRISSRQELNQASDFIDLIRAPILTFELMGLTLTDLRCNKAPQGLKPAYVELLVQAAESTSSRRFEAAVARYLLSRCMRKATRVEQAPFLALSSTAAPLGVPKLYSALQDQLQSMGRARHACVQWVGLALNLRSKGVRQEELDRSGLMTTLREFERLNLKPTGSDLSDACHFDDLHLSVIPVVQTASTQVTFGDRVPEKVVRTKKLPKPQLGQRRGVKAHDPILGYRIEEVIHDALWGSQSHWQAVTHVGEVLANECGVSLMDERDDAEELATRHALMHYPKTLATGRWAQHAWTGSRDYREWLITLPLYRGSYFSPHFKDVRNVLAHVRCDIRDDEDGKKVLLLQEVQSDWAQTARSEVAEGKLSPDDPTYPPFLREWTLLTLKLMLLHAVANGIQTVAWNTGGDQAKRWRGLGEAGLRNLYDKTLTEDANRLLKPWNIQCETVEVYVPLNFRITRDEAEFSAWSDSGVLIGTSDTHDGAWALLPTGAEERLHTVHGVRLSGPVRSSLLNEGLPAWGFPMRGDVSQVGNV